MRDVSCDFSSLDGCAAGGGVGEAPAAALGGAADSATLAAKATAGGNGGCRGIGSRPRSCCRKFATPPVNMTRVSSATRWCFLSTSSRCCSSSKRFRSFSSMGGGVGPSMAMMPASASSWHSMRLQLCACSSRGLDSGTRSTRTWHPGKPGRLHFQSPDGGSMLLAS